MPRKSNRRPSYLFHKPSGRARVRINGTDIYLGKYNSPESWAKYHEIVAKYPTPESRQLVIDDDAVCIAELVAKYVEFADEYYRNNRDERYRIRAAIKPLIELYGDLQVSEFSPKKLKAVRHFLIEKGLERNGQPLSRKYVNQITGVIKKIFKWGVSEECVPIAVHQSLSTVTGLRKGRNKNVREPARVKPVPETHIDAALNQVSPQIATMIRLQLLTGMRPDEVTIMRPSDVDRTQEIWIYTIGSRFADESTSLGSKTDWREGVNEKRVMLGPKAQKELAPWLEGREATEFLFQPKEVLASKNFNLPRRPPREHYDDETYARAVKRACIRAGVPTWTPGRLRHNAATRLRRDFGAEIARLILGHRHLSTTEIYAEIDREKCEKVVKKSG